MRSSLRFVTVVIAIVIAVQSAWAEKGKVTQDKVTAYLTPGATDKEAVIAIWASNVNPVIGITLPFKFAAGEDTLRLDSVSAEGGRARNFLMIPPQFKVAGETFLVNMIGKSDSVTHKMASIPSGEGPLMWLYVRTDGKFPLEKLRMASVQLPPENTLLFVVDSYATVNPTFELVRKAPPSETAQPPGKKGAKKS